jgi:hypothetical protein
MKNSGAKSSMFNFLAIKSEEAVLGFVIIVLLSLLIYKHWKGQPALAPPKKELEIKQLIETVKQQLEAADQEREADGKAPLFRVETFQLEVNFVVKDSHSANASGNFEVVTVGGQTEFSREQVQKISLQFKAIDYGSKLQEMPSDAGVVPIPVIKEK